MTDEQAKAVRHLFQHHFHLQSDDQIEALKRVFWLKDEEIAIFQAFSDDVACGLLDKLVEVNDG